MYLQFLKNLSRLFHITMTPLEFASRFTYAKWWNGMVYFLYNMFKRLERILIAKFIAIKQIVMYRQMGDQQNYKTIFFQLKIFRAYLYFIYNIVLCRKHNAIIIFTSIPLNDFTFFFVLWFLGIRNRNSKLVLHDKTTIKKVNLNLITFFYFALFLVKMS